MDDELQLQMEHLYQEQQKWLKIQGVFLYLSLVFFWLAFVLLFIDACIPIIIGGKLTDQAASLARKKYPFVPLAPDGKRISETTYLIAEAKRLNDDLTVKILKYKTWSILCFGAAILGNCALWTQVSMAIKVALRSRL